MNDTKPDEPLLIVNRARRFYGPFYAVVKILQFYLAIVFIMLDKPYAPIVGWVMLIGLFYAEIIPNCFKFIACYEDKVIVRYIFWQRILKYDEIKYIATFAYLPGGETLCLKLKFNLANIVFNLSSIILPLSYITKEDFEKLKILMSDKNIEYRDFI
jgi:hypothetical protein